MEPAPSPAGGGGRSPPALGLDYGSSDEEEAGARTGQVEPEGEPRQAEGATTALPVTQIGDDLKVWAEAVLGRKRKAEGGPPERRGGTGPDSGRRTGARPVKLPLSSEGDEGEAPERDTAAPQPAREGERGGPSQERLGLRDGYGRRQDSKGGGRRDVERLELAQPDALSGPLRRDAGGGRGEGGGHHRAGAVGQERRGGWGGERERERGGNRDADRDRVSYKERERELGREREWDRSSTRSRAEEKDGGRDRGRDRDWEWEKRRPERPKGWGGDGDPRSGREWERSSRRDRDTERGRDRGKEREQEWDREGDRDREKERDRDRERERLRERGLGGEGPSDPACAERRREPDGEAGSSPQASRGSARGTSPPKRDKETAPGALGSPEPPPAPGPDAAARPRPSRASKWGPVPSEVAAPAVPVPLPVPAPAPAPPPAPAPAPPPLDTAAAVAAAAAAAARISAARASVAGLMASGLPAASGTAGGGAGLLGPAAALPGLPAASPAAGVLGLPGTAPLLRPVAAPGPTPLGLPGTAALGPGAAAGLPNLEVAVAAARKAAEMVNQGFGLASLHANDSKKKALWANKKEAAEKERLAAVGSNRWDTVHFGDSEREEKFQRLMGVKHKPEGEGGAEGGGGGPSVSKAFSEEQQREYLADLERQFSQGLRRRDGRTVGLGL